MSTKGLVYKPRNDFVIVRASKASLVHGLVMPEVSAESEVYHVVACGPKVEGLEVGQRVLMTGKAGVDYSRIPGTKDLIVIRQDNVVLTIEEPDGKVVH